MNATLVLKKILQNLALVKEEVEFTYAKLADGTILESPAFDIGEEVSVVSEDGTKTPAPMGEHELILKDEEGNDVRIKIEVDAEGKITEKESAEIEAPMMPESEEEMESVAGGDMGGEESVATEETAEPIEEDMAKMIQKMQYRIEELEKKMGDMMAKEAETVKAEPLPGDKVEEMAAVAEEEEEELPKLDGAPIEENAQKELGVKLGKSNKLGNYQSKVLSKLYK